jgi:hypothetical protein
MDKFADHQNKFYHFNVENRYLFWGAILFTFKKIMATPAKQSAVTHAT